jgi:hypothetical protein
MAMRRNVRLDHFVRIEMNQTDRCQFFENGNQFIRNTASSILSFSEHKDQSYRLELQSSRS